MTTQLNFFLLLLLRESNTGFLHEILPKRVSWTIASYHVAISNVLSHISTAYHQIRLLSQLSPLCSVLTFCFYFLKHVTHPLRIVNKNVDKTLVESPSADGEVFVGMNEGAQSIRAGLGNSSSSKVCRKRAVEKRLGRLPLTVVASDIKRVDPSRTRR